LQATGKPVPAHRHLEGGLRLGVLACAGRSSSAATPNRAQHTGQTDAAAIFDEHRAKLLQERQADGVGTHHIFDGAPQERQQPVGGAFGKMAVQPLFLDAHSQAAGKAREGTGTGLGLLPPAQHQDQGHLHKRQLALTQSRCVGQFDAIVFKELFHHATHSCYTRHQLTPSRSCRRFLTTAIFSQESFVVTWLLTSTILHLTPMGRNELRPYTLPLHPWMSNLVTMLDHTLAHKTFTSCENNNTYPDIR